MRPGSCFREAAGEGETVIHFRRVLADCEEEAGSPCFPPRSLVQRLQSWGTEKKGEAARGGGDQSFFCSPLCFWPLKLSFFVLFLLCFSVFVFPRGPPTGPDLHEEHPCLPVPNKNTCSASDLEQRRPAGHPCHPCCPCTRAT